MYALGELLVKYYNTTTRIGQTRNAFGLSNEIETYNENVRSPRTPAIVLVGLTAINKIIK